MRDEKIEWNWNKTTFEPQPQEGFGTCNCRLSLEQYGPLLYKLEIIGK